MIILAFILGVEITLFVLGVVTKEDYKDLKCEYGSIEVFLKLED